MAFSRSHISILTSVITLRLKASKSYVATFVMGLAKYDTRLSINSLVTVGTSNRALFINWPFTNEQIVAGNLNANSYFEYGLFALESAKLSKF